TNEVRRLVRRRAAARRDVQRGGRGAADIPSLMSCSLRGQTSRRSLMIALKKILVPTDFGRLAKISLRYAKELARNFRAEVHVLPVLEEPPPFVWSGLEGAVPPSYAFMEGPLPQVHADLEKLLADAESEHVTARLAIRRGSALAEIVRYARAHAIDVIV